MKDCAMPLDRAVLLVVCVVAAAGVTIWLGVFLSAIVTLPVPGLFLLLPVGLAVWLAWRVIAERLNNREDDHYDQIEK